VGDLLLKSLSALLLAAACATTGAGRRPSTEEALARAESDVEKGRILYEASCDRCHALYMPDSYGAGEWRYYVDKYGRKSRLDKAEQGLVYRYLELHCAK